MNLNKVRVKEAMDTKGIPTYTELAYMLGITKNQLSVMLSDTYSPFKSRVEGLCEILQIAPIELLGFENTKQVEQRPFSSSSVTAIELFAGAGGLALGLEKAGVNTVAYVEIDKFCCETLRKNRPHWNVVNSDISEVDFSEYKDKVDIITGGFPCQAFSYAGKKLGFNDTRGTLFYEFARCVQEVDPKVFLAENVRGLVSHDNGRTFETIMSVLGEMDYDIQYRILNAAYHGVGQKRERLVIVGTKRGMQYNFPEPEEKMTTLRTALKDCPESEGQAYSKRKKEVLEYVPPGGSWVDLPHDVQLEYMGKSYYSGGGRRGMARRISWDEPCLTLTCSPSQKQTERCHPEETRPFTVREYARIQSFPDDWDFCGGIGEKYKQIGNAVPVEMARRIGISLKNCMEDYRSAAAN